MLNINNFTMLKVIARHFCFIFIPNIDDFDVAGLLVFIFVQKALDVHQNAIAHMRSPKKYAFSLCFLSKNSESAEKALDIYQNAKGHM